VKTSPVEVARKVMEQIPKVDFFEKVRYCSYIDFRETSVRLEQ